MSRKKFIRFTRYSTVQMKELSTPPRIKVGSKLAILYDNEHGWLMVKVIEKNKEFDAFNVSFDNSTDNMLVVILPENYRPTHENCASPLVIGTNKPYWAMTVPPQQPDRSREKGNPLGKKRQPELPKPKPKKVKATEQSQSILPPPEVPVPAAEPEVPVNTEDSDLEDDVSIRLRKVERIYEKQGHKIGRLEDKVKALKERVIVLEHGDKARVKDDDVDEDDPNAPKCFHCNKSCEFTGLTFLSCFHKILHDDTVPKSSIDMKNIIGARVSKKSPLRRLSCCKECIDGANKPIAFLSSQPNVQCQWCRCSMSKGMRAGFAERLCKVCSGGVIKIESDVEKDHEFLKRGLNPLLSLLDIRGHTDVIMSKRDDVDAIIDLRPVMCASLEIDAGHAGYSQVDEWAKNLKNIDALKKLHLNPRSRVHFRIDPMFFGAAEEEVEEDDAERKDNHGIDPLARWLILRDLIVLIYRMLEKEVDLGVDDPLFYICYNKKSNLIQVERKPFLIYHAVALPRALMEVDDAVRQFAEWECVVDPLAHHLTGKDKNGAVFASRWLAFEKRIPLDECERRGG